MKNPERLKYLMRAGHRATRDDAPAQPLATATLNSTALLQRQAQALEAATFEEDPEVQAEVEKRIKQASKPATKVNHSLHFFFFL